MSNIYRITLVFVIAMFVVSCAAGNRSTPLSTKPSISPSTVQPATTQPTPSALLKSPIVRHPAVDDFSGYFSQLTSVPKFDPNSED